MERHVQENDTRELDPYQAGCPTRRILDLIGGRWTVLIVGALSPGTARFSELQRRVDGISQKMLTQTLRAMERDGLVVRTVTAEVPGVRFVDEGQPHGLPLGPDDRVEVAMGFVVQDCARLRRTGRLVLRALQAGVESEVALTVTTDVEAGTVRQLALDRVLGSCDR